MSRWWWRAWVGAGLLLLAACQTAVVELQGLAEQAPLDCTVLVTGGAFRSASVGSGTFAPLAATGPGTHVAEEAFPLAEVLLVLGEGRVFQRVVGDADAERRAQSRAVGGAAAAETALGAVLGAAQAEGLDLVLVVEELRDGPVDALGVNGRWPVTFISWLLLGIGAVIPDHTFESRASLRVTLRDAWSGRVLADPVSVGGPIELSLAERGSFWGLLQSMLIPPFWVQSDPDSVRQAVRTVVQRRLLVSLARELKSEAVRQRLQERRAASLALVDAAGEGRVVVECAESLAAATLRAPGLAPEQAAAFERALLDSRASVGERLRYQAVLPRLPGGGLVQVAVATLRGEVASATFAPRGRP
jgi:hypothetical protein